jgi:hypothetical protein
MIHNHHPEYVALLLQGCLFQMDASREWFATRALPLSLDQLRWRPAPFSWSILECLNCLNQAYEYYLPKLERTIDDHRREPAERNEFSTVSDVLFPESERDYLEQMEPLAESQSAAQSSLPKIDAADPDRIVDAYPLLRDRYATAIRSASGLDFANILIEGSIHPPVRSLGGIIALLAAYDRRYIWQAEHVMKAAGFPASVSRSL